MKVSNTHTHTHTHTHTRARARRACLKGSKTTGELMGLNHQNVTDTFTVVEPVLRFLHVLAYSKAKQLLCSGP